MMTPTHLSSTLASAVPAFAALPAEKLNAFIRHSDRRFVHRGEVLVRQGEPSDALYFVISGRFAARHENAVESFAEIGPGQPIGEIGFFADVPRTATVVALRDSEVLTITREHFRQLGDSSPNIHEAVIVSLANRLAEARGTTREMAIPRTLALLPAGGSRLSPRFLETLRSVCGEHRRVLFLSEQEVVARFPDKPFDDPGISSWLNSLEAEAEFLFLVAGQELSEWTKKCVRQADVLLLIATAGADTDPNSSERFAFSVHPVVDWCCSTNIAVWSHPARFRGCASVTCSCIITFRFRMTRTSDASTGSCPAMLWGSWLAAAVPWAARISVSIRPSSRPVRISTFLEEPA